MSNFLKVKSKTQKDYILTFLTEFMVIMGGVLVYKLASLYLGEQGFSEYALTRRTISFIHPVLFIGLSVGIPRYIAFAMAEQRQEKADTYFFGGFLAVSIITLVVLTPFIIFKNWISYLFFGSSSYAYLVLPFVLMLVGLVLHSLCYSYYRGKVLMVKANIMQIINIGVVPLVAFYFGNTVTEVLYYTGLTWLLITIIFLIEILFSIHWEKALIKSCTKEIFLYGIQRIPGDFGLSFFFAAPAFFVVHVQDMQTAGYVAFGISLLTMIGSAFSPFSLILLPETSKLIAEKNFQTLNKYTRKIFNYTLLLTIIGVIVFELLTDYIITLYVGSSSPELIYICRIIIIASLGYTVYVTLRSVLDAYFFKAVNTRNIFISFVFFIIFSAISFYLTSQYSFILYGFCVSMIFLGGLTKYEIIKITKMNN